MEYKREKKINQKGVKIKVADPIVVAETPPTSPKGNKEKLTTPNKRMKRTDGRSPTRDSLTPPAGGSGKAPLASISVTVTPEKDMNSKSSEGVRKSPRFNTTSPKVTPEKTPTANEPGTSTYQMEVSPAPVVDTVEEPSEPMEIQEAGRSDELVSTSEPAKQTVTEVAGEFDVDKGIESLEIIKKGMSFPLINCKAADFDINDLIKECHGKRTGNFDKLLEALTSTYISVIISQLLMNAGSIPTAEEMINMETGFQLIQQLPAEFRCENCDLWVRCIKCDESQQEQCFSCDSTTHDHEWRSDHFRIHISSGLRMVEVIPMKVNPAIADIPFIDRCQMCQNTVQTVKCSHAICKAAARDKNLCNVQPWVEGSS